MAGQHEIDPRLPEMHTPHRQEQQDKSRLQAKRGRELEVRARASKRERERLSRYGDRTALSERAS